MAARHPVLILKCEQREPRRARWKGLTPTVAPSRAKPDTSAALSPPHPEVRATRASKGEVEGLMPTVAPSRAEPDTSAVLSPPSS
jgi:hypothetical protein